MRFLIFIFIFVSNYAWGQLINSVELTEKINSANEELAKKELLHLATLKSFEKFVPELGYKWEEFNEKLNGRFNDYFSQYKEKKLVEKFGAGHKETLTEAEKGSFLSSLESERHEAFIRFSKTTEVLRSHTFGVVTQNEKDPTFWKAKVEVDIDKTKLDKFLRKIINGENRAYSKVILVGEIDPFDFSWSDLALENKNSFLGPLNQSWLKWLGDNLPSTVEEVVACDENCLNYFAKWSETHWEGMAIPEEFTQSVFLTVNLHLKRKTMVEGLQEVNFEWEGRTVLHDISTKKVIGSFVLPLEKRTFRQLDQKGLNSALASSLYRSPLTAFMQFNRKLEEKAGFNRVSKLVIKGHRHLGDVLLLMEKLKTRGSSLGLEAQLDHFSKEEANLLCFYRGEEKSFTDLLSALKELKSTHSYTLVNEFTGVHYVIKFVTE